MQANNSDYSIMRFVDNNYNEEYNRVLITKEKTQ
jgi:hypothetical protein